MQQQQIKISLLKTNSGQIEGLPKNPRLIKSERFDKLVKSIQEDPEMLELRELIVYPLNDEFVVIAGNMRLSAMKELKYKEAPCKVLDADTTVEKLKAYTIKDNVPFGENDWSDLANEWDEQELTDWGLDFDFGTFQLEKSKKGKEVHELKNYEKTHVLISFSPEKLMEIQDLLEKLKSFEFIEYEQSSN